MLGITTVVHNRSVLFDPHLSNYDPDPICRVTYLDFDLDHDSDPFPHGTHRFAWEEAVPYSRQEYVLLNLVAFHHHHQNFAKAQVDYSDRDQVAVQAFLPRIHSSIIQVHLSLERSFRGSQLMAHVDLEVASVDQPMHCFHPRMPLPPPVFEQLHCVEYIRVHPLDPGRDDNDLS
jgi:hypothetical protein